METLLVVPVFTIAVALFAVLILLHFVPMGLWIFCTCSRCKHFVV